MADQADEQRGAVEPPSFDLDVEAPAFWESPRRKPLCVIALGGNAIDPPDSEGTYEAQMEAIERTAKQIVDVMKAGYKVVLTHGNGPQVGALLLQQEQADLPPQPLSVCGAMTQGQIGYMLTQQMYEQLERRWKHVPVACLITQTIIDPNDPALENPTKPIGPFVDEARAEEMREEGMAVTKVRDSGDRDYRRVVPSPEPKGIVEEVPVKRLIDQRDLVICGGGGGVPVSREPGQIDGYDAVIDKDLLTQVVGDTLDANYLMLLTDVDGVYRNFGADAEELIDEIDTETLRAHLEAGEFPPGSMGPKVDALIRFVEGETDRTRRGIIASLSNAVDALESGAGTHVVNGD